jgi:hypothetical protein
MTFWVARNSSSACAPFSRPKPRASNCHYARAHLHHPKTWAHARSAGVRSRKIDEYADLLAKLNANEELSGVAGLGETCLIVADITYGLFDNGVTKATSWHSTIAGSS